MAKRTKKTPPKTRKIDGKIYKLHSCGAAKSTAKKIRRGGNHFARAINGCTYTRKK